MSDYLDLGEAEWYAAAPRDPCRLRNMLEGQVDFPEA